MHKSEKQWYFHYLLHLLIKPIKSQLHQTTNLNFQLKLFNIAVTMKYGKGH